MIIKKLLHNKLLLGLLLLGEEIMVKKNKSKADQAFEIQEKIGKLIDKLNKLGFEYMYHNQISSIRRLRK